MSILSDVGWEQSEAAELRIQSSASALIGWLEKTGIKFECMQTTLIKIPVLSETVDSQFNTLWLFNTKCTNRKIY